MSLNKRFVLLKGCAGLGNRLITATAASVYAKDTGRKIHIDWNDGQFSRLGENAFDLYFEFKDDSIVANAVEVYDRSLTCYPSSDWQNEISLNDFAKRVSIYQHPILLSLITGKFARWLASWSLRVKNQHVAIAPFSNNFLELGEFLPRDLVESVVVFASFRPMIDLDMIKDTISPKRFLIAEIEQYAMENDLGASALGVHVRFTDKAPSSALSKLKLAIEKHSGLVEKIFLATDNKNVQAKVKTWFPNVISMDKFYPDEYTGGIHQYAVQTGDYERVDRAYRESIMDMWLLSKCKYLLYQGNSSFSLISHHLRESKSNSHDWMKEV